MKRVIVLLAMLSVFFQISAQKYNDPIIRMVGYTVISGDTNVLYTNRQSKIIIKLQNVGEGEAYNYFVKIPDVQGVLSLSSTNFHFDLFDKQEIKSITYDFIVDKSYSSKSLVFEVVSFLEDGKNEHTDQIFLTLNDTAMNEEIPVFTIENKQIKVASNSKFVLTLKSNSTTGYTWLFAEELNTEMLNLISQDYIPTQPIAIGSGGSEVFKFEALKSGTVALKLIYARPHDPTAGTITEFEIIVD